MQSDVGRREVLMSSRQFGLTTLLMALLVLGFVFWPGSADNGIDASSQYSNDSQLITGITFLFLLGFIWIGFKGIFLQESHCRIRVVRRKRRHSHQRSDSTGHGSAALGGATHAANLEQVQRIRRQGESKVEGSTFERIAPGRPAVGLV